MTAPERIYRFEYIADGHCDGCPYVEGENTFGGQPVEYIRADLVPAWQPIATAPRDGTKFLGLWEGFEANEDIWVETWAGVGQDGAQGWMTHWTGGAPREDAPAGWMPLPQAPALAPGDGTDMKEG